MAEKLTPQQQLAVENRGGKLLVSAAAGSGKTKVLVDRLMGHLTDSVTPANIDEFLIITYTKAAATELRGKIASKLSERIAENPSNHHLQRQLQRLYLTKISTIHSFCSDVIREYAYMLDVSADFRVADENECLELQTRILDQILENAYANSQKESSFCTFIDTQGFGRNDKQIPEIILSVYNSARCHPDPDAWLDGCLSAIENRDQLNPEDTVWGRYLMEDLYHYLTLQISALDRCLRKAECADNMQKPAALLKNTIDQLKRLKACTSWNAIRSNMQIDYGRLIFSKKCTDLQLEEEIKAIRAACKDGVAKRLSVFSDTAEQTLRDLQVTAAAARGLVDLVRKFSAAYETRKKQRRVLDFGDLEHKMLDLLLGKKRTGITNTAVQIGNRFREVMIDEYQDSNEVQDQIFSALTEKRQNCFMVGDVKQSIYQFRLADPDIFLKKYNSYPNATDAEAGEGRKVILTSNFRSSGGVISAVNDVFRNCMSKEVGGVSYDESEYLQEGIPHIPLNEAEIELYGICVQEDTYAEEAAFTAKRIEQLLDGTHMIRDRDSLRPILPEDIVILLRSPGSVGNDFKLALEARGICCNSGSNADLLESEEVAVLRSILQVISNPHQDVPLVSALASRVFCFTADELASIRAKCKHSTFYDALIQSDNQKVNQFLETLNALSQDALLYGLSRLIHQVFVRTRIDSIYSAMSDGAERNENLQMFCSIAESFEAGTGRGLDAFLSHLQTLEEKGVPNSPEKSTNGGVTIMSIHKSKGLEFPVVFLCGLSRSFNRESARAQVLCHKDLGLGLSCIDEKNRVRYPSLARRALSRRILKDSISEEMRVLYVAMTRPKDRLIMTYASKTLDTDLNDILLRSPYTDPELMTSEVISPGEWILQAALKRTEAGEFFNLTGSTSISDVSQKPWKISVIEEVQTHTETKREDSVAQSLPSDAQAELLRGLSFEYLHLPATTMPSKLTATQLKGRLKDSEIAEKTENDIKYPYVIRKPAFLEETMDGKDYGNAFHGFMQYADFGKCSDFDSVKSELDRMISSRILTQLQADAIDIEQIVSFFTSELGVRIRNCSHVLREFKFSILDEGTKYDPGVIGELVLLQGVVDCALIEPDGITVIDFKTDRVSEESIKDKTEQYHHQICAYAQALSRIYQLPVKEMYLHFFRLNRSVPVIL